MDGNIRHVEADWPGKYDLRLKKYCIRNYKSTYKKKKE